MTDTVLDRILAHKHVEVVQRRRARSLADMIDCARSAPPVRGFANALVTRIEAGEPAVIAEPAPAEAPPAKKGAKKKAAVEVSADASEEKPAPKKRGGKNGEA